ncbi:class Ib ribonucleoside-diphosphate reductase assembly flavoprotein NrdI [Carnobacterium gallinarum]|uniref:class Ib ribonucleoside-diphosphate reductase assembly flavoprotein NrdI n=1 Tax=Carnobacterium gallinarum TaxID=2749 RepID=UPI001B8053ED|nr:class Ib ribonucleoside-diphosphate reductase assembly flavoprotein NrdI [Carnobacterium gallinarum]
MQIIYFSCSGNTRAFVKSLIEHSQLQHRFSENNPVIEAKEITDQTEFFKEEQSFIAFVPTYLDGGNGIDNGTTEIVTNTLGEYIAYEDNFELCLGVVGSGNKNFNWQYCLTAKQYAEKFGIPFLADYELRGTSKDTERIYQVLKELKENG